MIPVGIAKDGHVIYGPYKEDGTLWNACDLDLCNGMYLNENIYAYATTTFHPYFVGCWGPGNYLYNMSTRCSTNGKYCEKEWV